MNTHGILVLFGSGETLDTGRKIQRTVLFDLPRKQHVAVLETPAGFQPNSESVATDLAEIFQTSLQEFVEAVSVIPARKKGTTYSPDNLDILSPLDTASYIMLGPGSPTYAAKQLQDSKALEKMIDRWKNGATLVLSSAAAIASGEYVLPVYEIYKAGHDIYWEKGLNIMAKAGFSCTVLPHWNNTDGGTKLDTSHCFMGRERFEQLSALLPQDHPFLCIDEHTAVIFYGEKDLFQVRGKGELTLIRGDTSEHFSHGYYRFSDLVKGIKTAVSTD